jgi:hypothetical protein
MRVRLRSQGLLVMGDPDTPFLHVGLNAPRAGDGLGWIQRSWGVGVQNMAREYLPRSALARASGDGLLRLQVPVLVILKVCSNCLPDFLEVCPCLLKFL